MTAAVEAHGITKRYGDRVAVDNLTFSAREGEVLGVLGPNGAGKTTAIRVLTTMLEPTAGTFTVAGASRDRPSEIRRAIGVLPERSGYPGQQTGSEGLGALEGRTPRGARDGSWSPRRRAAATYEPRHAESSPRSTLQARWARVRLGATGRPAPAASRTPPERRAGQPRQPWTCRSTADATDREC